MYYIGKFYGFLLFEENGRIFVSQGSSIFKDSYESLDKAKEEIQKWKKK